MIHIALLALDFCDAPMVRGPATMMFSMEVDDVMRVGAEMRQRHEVRQADLVDAIARCFHEGRHIAAGEQQTVASIVAGYVSGTQAFKTFCQMRLKGLMIGPHGLWLRLMSNSRTGNSYLNVVSIEARPSLEDRMEAVRRDLPTLPSDVVDQFVLDLRPAWLSGLNRNALHFTGGGARPQAPSPTGWAVADTPGAGKTHPHLSDGQHRVMRYIDVRRATFH